MSDSLTIFGTEYTGVTGFKAQDGNSNTLAYIRPQGNKAITQNGNNIDVAEYSTVSVSVSSGGGSVDSVNGQTGTVVLGAADVGAAPAVTEVTVNTAGAVTQALDPGKIYHFTGALTSLTITLNTPGTGAIAQYHFDFDSGSTAPTVTLPNAVTMQGGTFTPAASKHYEVDILNGYGVSMAW